MIAVDTNVIVRLLTQDDKRQAAAAKALFAGEEIWIARTVLLEVGWVLRSLYGFEESTVCHAFTQLLGLKNVHVEDEPAVAGAIALTLSGVEFADALHFASRPAGAEFVTFDRGFVRRATRAGTTGVAVLGE